MSTSVRPALADDLPTVRSIDAATAYRTQPTHYLKAACDGDSRWQLWVVESAGSVGGFLFVERVIDEMTVLAVAVASDRQRAGLGAALLAAGLHWGTEMGLRRCLLEVRVSNTAAISLYHRYGFSDDGRRPRYYADGEDALLMSLELQESPE